MADDEDDSEHDDDGTSSGMNALATHVDLTDAELHDVTVVATTANEIEAMAILDALEDAGIPAMKRGGFIYLGGAGPCDVMVPRKLLESAKDATTKFRKNNPSATTNKNARSSPEELRGQLAEGVGLACLGALSVMISIWVNTLEVANVQITLIFGLPTLLTGFVMALTAHSELQELKKK